MRRPLPTNRLVVLALLGMALTGAVAVTLAVPGIIPADPATDGGSPTGAPAVDAPTPNPDFTPAVQTSTPGGHEEHEAYEDDDRADEAEYEEEDHEEEWDDD